MEHMEPTKKKKRFFGMNRNHILLSMGKHGKTQRGQGRSSGILLGHSWGVRKRGENRFLLDVEAVETRGQASEESLDVDGGGLVLLGEVDGSGNVVLVGAENANSLDSHDVRWMCGWGMV